MGLSDAFGSAGFWASAVTAATQLAGGLLGQDAADDRAEQSTQDAAAIVQQKLANDKEFALFKHQLDLQMAALQGGSGGGGGPEPLSDADRLAALNNQEGRRSATMAEMIRGFTGAIQKRA